MYHATAGRYAVWFLVVLACASPGDPTTCHNDGPPIMTFNSSVECRVVVLESLRLAAQANKQVAYACEPGVAM